jgi:hypothetical protein
MTAHPPSGSGCIPAGNPSSTPKFKPALSSSFRLRKKKKKIWY